MKTVITSQQLSAFKSGDRKAFEEIYNTLHPQIYSYCNRFLRDAELAKEASVDVFVVLWQKRNIIDSAHPIEAFLYKVARDRSLSYLRKVAANNKMKEKYIAEYQASNEGDDASAQRDQASLSFLKTKIAKLPAQQKKIFNMRYLEGLNNQEIAEDLAISINTVKSHLLQARRFLRDQD